MRVRLKRIKVAPSWALVALDLLSRALARTQRVTLTDPHGFIDAAVQGPAIYAIWHNRLFLMPHLIAPELRHRLHFLASLSRDGGYIADYLSRLGMTPIRGSSSRGGGKALLELRRCLRQQGLVAITPDGPRGPRYHVQDGVAWLAATSGAPIVPVSYNAPAHWEAHGWDRTHLPKPFAKGELVVGDPIHLSKDLDDDALAAARERVHAALMHVTEHDHHHPQQTQ